MADVFGDDYESGDFSAWSGTSTAGSSTVTVQDTVKYAGTYAQKSYLTGTNVWAVAYETFGSSYSTIYSQFMVRFSALPTSGNRLKFGHLASAADDRLTLNIYNDSGTLKWEIDCDEGVGSTAGTSATPAVAVDTWYCFEDMFQKGDSNDGEAKAWIVEAGNGIAEGSPTIALNNLDNNYDINKIEVGAYEWATGLSTNVYYDNVHVNAAYIGCGAAGMQILTLRTMMEY